MTRDKADKVVERELREAKSEVKSLKRTVEKLRKRLSKADLNVLEDEVEQEVIEEPVKSEDNCPQCGAKTTSLTNPNKSKMIFCADQCGWRSKVK